jgi:hypothetical protein
MTHKRLHFKLSLGMLSLIFLLTACSQSQSTPPSPLPTITPISGWQKLSNEGFEIWLPESFIGGTNLDFDVVAQQMAKLGPDFEKQANALKKQRSSFLIFAIDKNRGNTGLTTNLIISKHLVSNNISMEKYMEALGNSLTEPYRVIEINSLPSDRYPTGVLLISANFPQVGEVSQIMYSVRNGGAIWDIIFSTPSNEFQERLPIFEEIVQTVNVPFTPENTAQQGNPISFGIGVALIIFVLLLKSWQKRKKAERQKSV